MISNFTLANLIVMSITKEKKNKKKRVINKVVVSEKVKDYGKHPFFVEKAKKAEAFLKEYGLPKPYSQK
jgi:hypothetical protein